MWIKSAEEKVVQIPGCAGIISASHRVRTGPWFDVRKTVWPDDLARLHARELAPLEHHRESRKLNPTIENHHHHYLFIIYTRLRALGLIFCKSIYSTLHGLLLPTHASKFYQHLGRHAHNQSFGPFSISKSSRPCPPVCHRNQRRRTRKGSEMVETREPSAHGAAPSTSHCFLLTKVKHSFTQTFKTFSFHITSHKHRMQKH